MTAIMSRTRGDSDAFAAFLSAALPLLSAKEEVELGRLVCAGDADARERMIRSNLRLVADIAKRYRGRGLDLEDLVAEGQAGLIRAVEKFDPERGLRFSTLATWWIRQTVSRAVRDKGSVVRVPAHVHDLVREAHRAAIGDAAGPSEITGRDAVTVDLARKALARRPVAPEFDDGPADHMDWHADRRPGPADEAERNEVADWIAGLLGHLKPRDA
jgi:RNA polymerase sigma factor (sigma-70 family)